MKTPEEKNFKHNCQTHLNYLKLKGLQPATIDSYARAIRRIGAHFRYQLDDLSEAQLTDYFTALLGVYKPALPHLGYPRMQLCPYPL